MSYAADTQYTGGMLAPDWFDNVTQDHGIQYLKLSDIPEDCPSTLQLLVNQMIPGMFIAGGSCITIFDKFHRFGDIDIWVNTEEAYQHSKQLMDIWGFRTNAKSDALLQEFDDGFTQVQIIKSPKLKCLEDLISTFDIRACKVGIDYKRIAYNQSAKYDIENKIITCAPISKDPVKLFFRIIKYASRGYKVTPQQIRDIWNANKQTVTAPLKLDLSGKLDEDALLRTLQDMIGKYPTLSPATISPYINPNPWNQPLQSDPYGTINPKVPYTWTGTLTGGTTPYPSNPYCTRCGSTSHSNGGCY